MAYSKVSLICGLLTFLVISNGVSARWLDDIFAQIKMEDIHEEEHHSAESQKPGVEMWKSHAPAPAPQMSINQLSAAAGRTYGFDEETPIGGAGGAENDHDEDDEDSSIDSDSTFQPNGTDDDYNETDNSDDAPLP